jgi:hypothetical protein
MGRPGGGFFSIVGAKFEMILSGAGLQVVDRSSDIPKKN